MNRKKLSEGTVLFGTMGSYVLTGVLGRGGFSIVYSAIASGYGLPQNVVVKEFFPCEICRRSSAQGSFDIVVEKPDNLEMFHSLSSQFKHETEVLKTIHHSGIIQTFEVFECNGTVYSVQEMIEGCNMCQIVNNYREKGITLPVEDAAHVILSVADILQYLHERRIAHLDVKPANIMLSSDNRVFLLDFGTSLKISEKASKLPCDMFGISEDYASPERYGGFNAITTLSDVYSLGATFYNLLTGMKPSIIFDELYFSLMSLDIPFKYKSVILKAMNPNLRKRTPSISDFAKDLKMALDKEEEKNTFLSQNKIRV